ncbi:hypothetical protein OVY29_05335 [Sphingopyxis sp. SE2]|uniref:hypothetical protein n=1 Tax=Sphingopyxis sp. SE2 TaxID=1586240 RepID=UPI0028C0604B|nr:hypothetical protein [Sphingopyxis sp. SE2]MDT7528080.1 hypothetical protein [Sphingopyxis sp. SE2]
MMLILTDGTARVSMLTSAAAKSCFAYAAESGRGVPEEIALLDAMASAPGKPQTATSARGSASSSAAPRHDFAASYPEFAWSLMQQLARRLRTADQTIESDRAYAFAPRLARHLKRLICKDVDASQRVELSQTESAISAGMSREHINRQLKSWEESA